MPLASQTTAEHVIGAVEAIVVNGQPTSLTMIAEFLGTVPNNATAALETAKATPDWFLRTVTTTTSSVVPSAVSRPYLKQKAAVLRILIESYRPFTVFRERLVATADLNNAAQATRTICALPAHRDIVKETLISLGTFSRALIHEGGGNYQLDATSLVNALQVIASACKDMTIAEGRIRDQLGPLAQTVLAAQRDAVIVPLADALMRANNRDGSGAVQQAGNAVESHVAAMATRMGINIAGANGIIEKLNRFANPRRMPRYLIHVGSYLGAIRNAADHGPDADINNATLGDPRCYRFGVRVRGLLLHRCHHWYRAGINRLNSGGWPSFSPITSRHSSINSGAPPFSPSVGERVGPELSRVTRTRRSRAHQARVAAPKWCILVEYGNREARKQTGSAEHLSAARDGEAGRKHLPAAPVERQPRAGRAD